MLFELSNWTSWLAVPLLLWIGLYFLLGMKRMYKQKWGITIVKYATFLLIFSTCVGIGLMMNLALTLALI